MEAFTLYMMIGIFAGLALFLYVFTKWDLPAYCRKRFRLNTRVKKTLFIIVFGFFLALLLAMIMDMLNITGTVNDLVVGLSIGFNCALLAGILRDPPPANTGTGTSKQRTNSRNDGSGGRRSKG